MLVIVACDAVANASNGVLEEADEIYDLYAASRSFNPVVRFSTNNAAPAALRPTSSIILGTSVLN